ncbi:MAG TPA: ATP-grasp domain-containing protein [Syntrophorhabdales bacterium]|nr:ATP-grasp domain-containing protein [Syntrophorhabdales bacterium]
MKEILIIGGGLLLVPTVKVAKSMGLRVTVADQNASAPAAAYADDLLIASTYNPDEVIARIREHGWEQRFSGVFTAGADVEVTVAKVAETLRLPGIPPEVAHRTHNKLLTKEALVSSGVPTPRTFAAESLEETKSRAMELGLPVVIKPLNNCASRGVTLIEDKSDITSAFDLAKRFGSNGKILVESFVTGTTHTVEMIAWSGSYYPASIIDTVHGYPPFFVELYHVNPTRRSASECEQMVRLAEAAGRAVGIIEGVNKVDIIFSQDGPQVMEMTARLSGGFHCQYTTPLACGTNNIRAAISIALGEAPDTRDIVPQKHACAISKAVFPKPGIIRSIAGIEETRNIPGVAEVFVLKKEGDRVGPYQHGADRFAYVIAHGPDEPSVWKTLEKAEKTLRIET